MEPAFDDSTYARTFGLLKKADRAFADELVAALGKIDRALLPPAASHPLLHLIVEGPRGVDKLLDLVEKAPTAKAKKDAVDALAHVLLGSSPARGTVDRLKKQLGKEGDDELQALLAKTIAIAGDDAFLLEQTKRLGDDDPAIVAGAARLLGFGRYRPAVPILMGLVSPDHFYESRWVLWALGEIGDVRALPALEIALANGFRVVDSLIAIGKIGRLTSVPKLTPHLIGGTPDERDAAVRALAVILDKNRDDAKLLGPLADELAGMLERDLADPRAPLSGSTRFHMLLCLARLGHALDAARVKKYLGVTVEGDARHLMAFVDRRMAQQRAERGADKSVQGNAPANPFARSRPKR